MLETALLEYQFSETKEVCEQSEKSVLEEGNGRFFANFFGSVCIEMLWLVGFRISGNKKLIYSNFKLVIVFPFVSLIDVSSLTLLYIPQNNS